ncbi:unnamed protein product [Soboliphyme baturini]|uniref:Transposase n=1 Tax=Soboliphyme baturini TaxID=241478 RepID=A0A183INT6_9BILA|nr:unnamed protein product [Soboliphyme baturini]
MYEVALQHLGRVARMVRTTPWCGYTSLNAAFVQIP